jgi:hypothetical protein
LYRRNQDAILGKRTNHTPANGVSAIAGGGSTSKRGVAFEGLDKTSVSFYAGGSAVNISGYAKNNNPNNLSFQMTATSTKFPNSSLNNSFMQSPDNR